MKKIKATSAKMLKPGHKAKVKGVEVGTVIDCKATTGSKNPNEAYELELEQGPVEEAAVKAGNIVTSVVE